jgi:hypothetical protein
VVDGTATHREAILFGRVANQRATSRIEVAFRSSVRDTTTRMPCETLPADCRSAPWWDRMFSDRMATSSGFDRSAIRWWTHSLRAKVCEEVEEDLHIRKHHRNLPEDRLLLRLYTAGTSCRALAGGTSQSALHGSRSHRNRTRIALQLQPTSQPGNWVVSVSPCSGIPISIRFVPT